MTWQELCHLVISLWWWWTLSVCIILCC